MFYRLEHNGIGENMYQIKPILYYMDLKPKTLSADNVQKLQSLIRRWQTHNYIKAWHWSSPAVYKNGKLVGYMSYNGKLWDKNVFNGLGQEIEL
jgi:inactivated superfamily I helicase